VSRKGRFDGNSAPMGPPPGTELVELITQGWEAGRLVYQPLLSRFRVLDTGTPTVNVPQVCIHVSSCFSIPGSQPPTTCSARMTMLS
jgi:hypothetical protein